MRRLDFIDALRGYAILGVLLVHASMGVAPESPSLLRVFEFGARGVQLFYVTSALTLCMSWETRAAWEQQPVRNFYVRRLFRVLPMFYIAIVLYTLLYGLAPRYWAPAGMEWWFIPATALCLHGFHPETINSVVPGGWSIAIEMNFYLILPLLLRKVRTTASLLAFFLGSLLVYRLSMSALPYLLGPAYPPDQQYLVLNFVYLSFGGQLPVFAIGLLTFAILGWPRAVARAIGPAGLLTYALARWWAPHGSRLSILLADHVAVSLALGCFVLLLATWHNRWLTNRTTVWLGRLSYSMYLLHFAVLELLRRTGANQRFSGDLGSIAFIVMVIGATAALAWVTYMGIERLGIACGERIVSSWERAVASRRGPLEIEAPEMGGESPPATAERARGQLP